MKRLLFLIFMMFFSSAFTYADRNIPDDLKEFSAYLKDIPVKEKNAELVSMQENITLLIKSIDSQNISKIKKRKLSRQYAIILKKVEFEIKKINRNKAKTEIDFKFITTNKMTQVNNSMYASGENIISTGSQVFQNTNENNYYHNQSTYQSNNTNSNQMNNSSSTIIPSNTGITNTSNTGGLGIKDEVPKIQKIKIGQSTYWGGGNVTLFEAFKQQVEIGRFSITAGNSDIQLSGIKFSNLGSANFSDILFEDQDIQLHSNVPGSLTHDCGNIIEGNKIYLKNCHIGTIKKGTTADFKITVFPKTISNSLKKTIQLDLNSADIELFNLTNSGNVNSSEIEGNVLFNKFTIDYLPLNVWFEKAPGSRDGFVVNFRNSSSSNNVEIKNVTISINSNYGNLAKGQICIVTGSILDKCSISSSYGHATLNQDSSNSIHKLSIQSSNGENILNLDGRYSLLIFFDKTITSTPTAQLVGVEYEINGIPYNITNFETIKSSIEL